MTALQSTLYLQTATVLRRARAFPYGTADRNDLRQLAIGLRWLDRNAQEKVRERAEQTLDNKAIALGVQRSRL